MTTTLQRATTRGAGRFNSRRAVRRDVLERPPTVFGRNSPWEVVEAGHALAGRALGYVLENVPRDEALATLLAGAPTRDVAQMAWHYLAFTRFDTSYAAHAHALFLIQDVVCEIDERQRRQALPLHRAAAYLRDRLSRLRGRWRLPNSGGRLRPAI